MAIPKIANKVVTTAQESAEGRFPDFKLKFLPDLKAFAEKFGPTVFKMASLLAPLAIGAAVEGPLPKLVGVGLSVFIPFLLSSQIIDGSDNHVPTIVPLTPEERGAAEAAYRETQELLKDIKYLPSRVWVDWDETLVRHDGSIVGKTVGIVWAFYERGVEIGILSNATREHVENGLEAHPVIKRFVSRGVDGRLLVKTREDNERFADANKIPYLEVYPVAYGIFTKQRVPLKIVGPDELWLDDISPEVYWDASFKTMQVDPGAGNILNQTVANLLQITSDRADVDGLAPAEFSRLRIILDEIQINKKRIGNIGEINDVTDLDLPSEIYQYIDTMYRRFRYELFDIPFAEPLSRAEQAALRTQIRGTPSFWIETLKILYERQDVKEFFEVALALNLWPVEVDSNVTSFFQKSVTDLDDIGILTPYSPSPTVRVVYPGYSMLVFRDRHEIPGDEEINSINRGLAEMPPVLASIIGATLGTWIPDYVDDEVIQALQSRTNSKDWLQLFEAIKMDEHPAWDSENLLSNFTIKKRMIQGAFAVRSMLRGDSRVSHGATLVSWLAKYAGVTPETLVQWANGGAIIDVYSMAMLAAAARKSRITMSALRLAIIECSALPAKF